MIIRLRPGNSFLFWLSGITLSLLWQGCAQILAPQGGPKDIEPPVVLESNPANFATHFDNKKIELTFNEFIRLKDVRDNLVFSPVLKHDPDFLVKGKSLIITLHDTLEENTTYAIHFNDAIVDITEENPLSGFRYVFSTGDYIDSLRMQGSIVNAFNLQPEKNVLVMLYESADDSIPYLKLPRYISKSNVNGQFELSNIRKGTYKAFALQDKNRNYLYDPVSELIGFPDSMISTTSDSVVPFMNLRIFREDPDKQYLKRHGSGEHGRFMLKFNLPVKEVQLRELNGQLADRTLLPETSDKHDSLIYWIKPPDDIDTIRIEVTVEDSLVDTAFIAIKSVRKNKLTAHVTSNATGAFDLNSPLEILSDEPSRLDTSKIILVEDSVEIASDWIQADSVGKLYRFHTTWKENTPYTLTLLPGAIENLHGLSNDSLAFHMNTREQKYYGTLKIKIEGLDGNGILELSRESKLVDTSHVGTLRNQLYFGYLHPGEYGLKIIHDVNNNGTWDTGNYLKGRQPEDATIFQGTITIRSNWDQEIEWKFE